MKVTVTVSVSKEDGERIARELGIRDRRPYKYEIVKWIRETAERAIKRLEIEERINQVNYPEKGDENE